MCVGVNLFLYVGKDLSFFVERLPSLLLLQRTGMVDKEFVGLAWYLSSMVIGMALIYPLLRKHYSMFVYCIGPLSGALIIGYLIKTTSYLGGVSDWVGITYKCNLRAFAELSLGCTCFELSRKLACRNITVLSKFFLSLSVISTIFVVIWNICCVNRLFNDGVILLLLCFIIVAVFGKIGYFSTHNAWYNNRFLCYLGKLSLPVYLFQNILHYWVSALYKGNSIITRISIIYFGTIVLAMIYIYIKRLIDNARVKHKADN